MATATILRWKAVTGALSRVSAEFRRGSREVLGGDMLASPGDEEGRCGAGRRHAGAVAGIVCQAFGGHARRGTRRDGRVRRVRGGAGCAPGTGMGSGATGGVFRLAITLVQPSATVNVHRVPSLVIGWTLCPLPIGVAAATLEASARTRHARGRPAMTDATAAAAAVGAGRG
ncbi:hypothetical protein GCM10009548_71810 [Streptomyces malaysiensis subsp. malaysiensis]